MKFLEGSDAESWIMYDWRTEISSLHYYLKHSDICLSDLDDTDALSPAKKIAYHNLRKPGTWWWALTKGLPALLNKNMEGRAFMDYFTKFLSKEKYRNDAQSYLIRNGFFGELVFPGVKKFYERMGHETLKCCITRNIKEVARPFGLYFGLNVIYPEIFDKKRIVKQKFVEMNSKNIRKYIIRGDSDEDDEVRSFVEFHVKRKNSNIESCVSIWVAKSCSEHHTNKRFTLNTSRNQNLLADFIKPF